MKKNILAWVVGSKIWMGGVYYVKNMLFQLSLLEDSKKKYQIFLCANQEIQEEFYGLDKLLDMIFLVQDDNPEQLLHICDEYKIDIIFPVEYEPYISIVEDRCVFWIPDFQEQYFPQNFQEGELIYRYKTRKYIASHHASLVLSSNNAFKDYSSLFPEFIENVFVAHFISYIETELQEISNNYLKSIMEKYCINYKYIYVSNQFWKHKNHKVVFEAINEIINNRKEEIHLVCTGFMESYHVQKDKYMETLLDYIKENRLGYNIHLLGLVERKEQLCIMKNADLLIQPSLFEGWGCSLEDAKVMGKTVIVSDIEVHKEQKDDNCILFRKDDSKQLAEIILKQRRKVKKYDLRKGREQTYRNARKYAVELERAFQAITKNNGTKYVYKLEEMRKKKILELFGDLEAEEIGVYGTGRHTEIMLKTCKKILQNVRFFYFDSDSRKWGKEYHGAVICDPAQIISKGIKRVVISSPAYQEEIYRGLRKYENEIEIVKIYDVETEVLWI